MHIHVHMKLLIFTHAHACRVPPLIYLYYRKYEQMPLPACTQHHLVISSLEIMTFRDRDRDRDFCLPAVLASSTLNFLFQITQQLLNQMLRYFIYE